MSNESLIQRARDFARRFPDSAFPKEAAAGYITDLCDALETARQDTLLEAVGQIEKCYLGPDSGRLHDGRDAPDAALRNAYDEGLERAADTLREMAGGQ